MIGDPIGEALRREAREIWDQAFAHESDAKAAEVIARVLLRERVTSDAYHGMTVRAIGEALGIPAELNMKPDAFLEQVHAAGRRAAVPLQQRFAERAALIAPEVPDGVRCSMLFTAAEIRAAAVTAPPVDVATKLLRKVWTGFRRVVDADRGLAYCMHCHRDQPADEYEEMREPAKWHTAECLTLPVRATLRAAMPRRCRFEGCIWRPTHGPESEPIACHHHAGEWPEVSGCGCTPPAPSDVRP